MATLHHTPHKASEIKARLTLRGLAAELGIELPPDGKKFKHPFRPDNNPSCSIRGDILTDWSSGEHLDLIAFYGQAKNLSNADAIRELHGRTPGARCKTFTPVTKLHLPAEPLKVPPLTRTLALCKILAELRNLPEQAIQAAALSLGHVGFAKVCGHHCWLITDREGHIAEARRMDGQKFEGFGELGERKSHAIKGSKKSWPIGLTPKYEPPADMQVVAGEGGPDYLALCAVALETKPEFLPVVMLGSSAAIDPQALPGFAGRAVTILAHPDPAGQKAAVRWARQLEPIAATLRVLQLDGGDVNDLVSKMEAAEFSKEILQ